MMRVTVGSAARGSLAGLQSSASRLAALQSQLSSGRQITKPSDDPTGTANALRLRGELQRVSQYQQNADDGLSWLTTVDSALSGAVGLVQQVQTLALRGLNTGSGNATTNEALAQQVDKIRQTLLATANSSYLGRPVFGGNAAGSVAFDSAGSYVGDNGTVTRTVGPSASVDINQVGTDVFGANGNNVFDLLTDISAKLRTNPTALTSSLGQLDTALATLSSSQASAGAAYQRIQDVQNQLGPTSTAMKSQLSDLQDVDIASMAIEVSTANAAYQASLATTAKLQQNSLLDYLR
jgi:flagellar hook-associated protein 3 FlgL